MNCYKELDSTICCCGSRKGHGKSFCYKCWSLLPRAEQNNLYEVQGYALAVETAKKILRAKNRFADLCTHDQQIKVITRRKLRA
ncbi:MAG TPA: hypothetical protein VKZ53_22235 [Candidatus Angelobacter sp.]|nr:hypothetical protein [Candidatus Angelobacter sp.]